MTFNDNNNSNYEFTSEQNDMIAKLARMMRIVSFLFLFSGALSALGSFKSFSISGLLQSAALLIIGYSLLTAASSFKKIVDTTGNDIANLMEAIKQLYVACSIQLYSIAAVILLIVVTALLGV